MALAKRPHHQVQRRRWTALSIGTGALFSAFLRHPLAALGAAWTHTGGDTRSQLHGLCSLVRAPLDLATLFPKGTKHTSAPHGLHLQSSVHHPCFLPSPCLQLAECSITTHESMYLLWDRTRRPQAHISQAQKHGRFDVSNVRSLLWKSVRLRIQTVEDTGAGHTSRPPPHRHSITLSDMDSIPLCHSPQNSQNKGLFSIILLIAKSGLLKLLIFISQI